MSRILKYKFFLLFLLLGNYLSVAAIAGFGHTHEADFHFHDSCPACQWDVQSQEDFSDIHCLLSFLLDPLVVNGSHQIQYIAPSIQDNSGESYLSRAPPFLS